MIKAQGIGGGHIFKYCNKCGMTEHGIKEYNILIDTIIRLIKTIKK